ncbi:hypothetical protein AWB77_01329 [Caballeronia fortuita]|uniref:Uncharacterized protein n=1 Tax=Caballeronia fortuita TaxID=1777138 RepID=A0A158A1Q5_9BURK|nr:hypothetical protein [Caballeronia fortuita]SAK51673.1 hypothetical protein AWB77_01329 [Caballeronia fortuita]
MSIKKSINKIALLLYLLVLPLVTLLILALVVSLSVLIRVTGRFTTTGDRLRIRLLENAFPRSPYHKYYAPDTKRKRDRSAP